jgi:hypothetical protein
MFTASCLALYEFGVRVRQAIVLCDTHGTPVSRPAVLAAMIRLETSSRRLLAALKLTPAVRRTVKILVKACGKLIAGVHDFDEAGCVPACAECSAHLRTLLNVVTAESQHVMVQAPDAASWFQLGTEIAAGDGTTPGVAPPERQEKKNEARWRLHDELKVESLLVPLRIDLGQLLPEPSPGAPYVETYTSIQPCLWGWANIEAGLLRLGRELRDSEGQGYSGWDKPTHDRNEWIYEQCAAGVVYKTIVEELTSRFPAWKPIERASSVKRVAEEYARRKGLQPPPVRHPSRLHSRR